MEVALFIYSISCFIGMIALLGGPNARSKANWYKKLQPGIIKNYVDLCTGIFIFSFFAGMVLPILISIF